jgi:hypothetical protein
MLACKGLRPRSEEREPDSSRNSYRGGG